MCWKYNVKWFLLCVEWALTMRISRNLRYEKKNDDRDGHIQQYYLVPRLDLCILWCLLTWQEITSLHLSRLWLVQHETVTTPAYLENERTSVYLCLHILRDNALKGVVTYWNLKGKEREVFRDQKQEPVTKFEAKRCDLVKVAWNWIRQFSSLRPRPHPAGYFSKQTLFSPF